MKKNLISPLLTAAGIMLPMIVAFAAAQEPGATRGPDGKARPFDGKAQPLDGIEHVMLPPLDRAVIAAEDAQREAAGLPPRYAVPKPVRLRPATDGTWTASGEGTATWRLRVSSPGARTLNVGFTRYKMPPGGRLMIYSADGAHAVRPFTDEDNEVHAQLWTPVVPSDDIIIEVILPDAVRPQLDLELGSINIGYRGFRAGAGEAAMVASGSCNVDVICPQGDPWRDQIRSVGVISTGGGTFCTGFMVNNTAQDLTPYFMTANHCGINAGNAASLVVYWNYKNSTCRAPGSPASGGPGDGQLNQFQTGSFFRSSFAASDFTLVELDDDPQQAWNVVFAGWDRSTADSTSAVAIHHPNTDEKRISFENAATTTTSYLGTTAPGDGTHIRVIDWDLGTTEPGSSGSPLFNQAQRIVGQLHGGFAACGNNDSDWYGRISRSWTGGGTTSTRLSNWLDPGNTGAMFVDHVSGAGLTNTPAGDVLHVGEPGGPFTNPSVAYTLTNPSNQAIDYEVSLTASFGVLLNGGTSAITGTLAAAGGTVQVIVSLGPAIDALSAGVYVEDVVFDDLTNVQSKTRRHTVEIGQTLFSVTPGTGLESGGPVGGPFPGTILYAVTSQRPMPVTVKVSSSESWISIDGGTDPVMLDLSGTGDSDTVTIGFSADANVLASGIYNGSVDFQNMSGGTGDTGRAITLDVGRVVYTATDTPKPINDVSTVTSMITVADSLCIGDVNVDIDITHTYIGDLIVSLTSANGTVVRLHNRTGGEADDIVETFDDETNPPDGPGTLADFDFENSAGVWTLTVSDNAAQDTGTLHGWSLRIAPIAGNCPTPQVFHSFSLSTNPGWTTQGQWAFGQPTGGGSGSDDPTSGYTGPNVYGYNLAGDYPANMGATQYLTTTALDCSNIGQTRLRFRRWMGIESSSFDHANIQVSNNGSAWTTVWDHVGPSFGESAWSLQSYDISAVADGQSSVFIRWGMGPTDSSVQYAGWNLDDIEITGIASVLDCNENSVPDADDITLGTSLDCNSNLVPDECDIDDGTSDDCDADAIPDECQCVQAVAASGEPGGVAKNRYLSFMPPASGCPIALRVTMLNLPPPFEGLEGQSWWIGPPIVYPEGPTGGTFRAAALQCLPHYMDWTGVGLVHAFGAGVVPSASYVVEAIRSGCPVNALGSRGGDFSDPLGIDTGIWGDIAPPFGPPDFIDIATVVDKFRLIVGASIKARAQLQPNIVDPTAAVNFLDISRAVGAFRGAAYPFAGPTACP